MYTDCAVLLDFANSAEPLPLRHHFHELAKWARLLMAQAQSQGGIFVLRHVLRRYNKRADSLCNKATDDATTPILQQDQLYEPSSTLPLTPSGTLQTQLNPDNDLAVITPLMFWPTYPLRSNKHWTLWVPFRFTS